MDPSLILSLPASRRAFSSAWRQRQVDRLTPAPWPWLHLAPGLLKSVDDHYGIRDPTGPTSAFIAVGQVARGAIVAGTDHSIFPDYDTANPPLHAIASMGSQRRQLHEILVPAGPQSFLFEEVQSV